MNAPHNLFNTLADNLTSATANRGNFIRCPRWKRPASARSPSCRSPSASCSNPSCAIATARKSAKQNVTELANWKPNAERARRKSRSWSRASCCRISPACRCWWIWRRCARAVAKLGKNPKIIEPLVPVDLVVDHSVQVDFAGARRCVGSESGTGIQAQPRALPVSEMGHAGVRHVQGRAAGHRHRASGESGISRQGRADAERTAFIIPTRWSARIRTRR